MIDESTIHVFLTPEGDCNGLYVADMSGKGFSVREQNGGASELSFSYRVVGQRKDVQAKRTERVKLPKHPPGEAGKSSVKTKAPDVKELPS